MQLYSCSVQKCPDTYGVVCCSSTEQISSLSHEWLFWVEEQRHSPLAVVRSVTAEFSSAMLSRCLVPSVPHFPCIHVGLSQFCAAAVVCIYTARENTWSHSFCQHLAQYPSASLQRAGNCPKKLKTPDCLNVRADFFIFNQN